MKKLILIFTSISMLAGCANMTNPLDNQHTSKGTKTAEATGAGAVVGALAAKLFGFNAKWGAILGGAVAGYAEYEHASAIEIRLAKQEQDKLKAKNIVADVETHKVSVNDGGVKKTTLRLKTFSVRSTSDEAVGAVAHVAKNSPFKGRIVVVASPRREREIRRMLAQGLVDPSQDTVAFVPEAEARKYGAKPGIAFVPLDNGEAVSHSA